MENSTTAQPVFSLKIDDTARQHLLTMASWAMIIVIAALIKYVFSIIEYFRVKDLSNYQIGEMNLAARSSNLSGVIINIIIGLAINYFLFQFSSLTKKGVHNHSQLDLNLGLRNLRTYFAIIGILLIIILAFAALGIAAGGLRTTS